MVELVADARHRQLVDDLAILGVDDGDEVGCLDTGALVETGEVEELLRRRLHCLLRRTMEGSGLVVFGASRFVGHRSSFRSVFERWSRSVLSRTFRRSFLSLLAMARACETRI